MFKNLNLENNSFNRLFMFGFAIIVLVVSILTPPFQSPDEFAHFERAYTISNGQFFLDDKGNGNIDKNLTNFEHFYKAFPFKYEKKNTIQLEHEARNIHWANEEHNISLVNTAVYFPIPYIPQAIGISIGRYLDFPIYDSYRLAKLMGILNCLILLFTANKIYPITPIGYFILSLPMVIFQISSTTPDGMVFSLSLLFGCIVARGLNAENSFSIYYFMLICFVFFIISTMKINLFPMILLLILICNYRKLRCGYRFFLITLTFILGWLLFAYSSFLSGENFSQGGLGVGGKLKYYLEHKNEFLQIFINTFSSSELIGSHIKQFIGVLGWLDTSFSYEKYLVLLFFGSMILLLSLRKVIDNKNLFFNIFILISGILLTYFLLLLTWTPVTEQIIHGVQGRYFIPLVLGFTSMLTIVGKKYQIANILVLISLIYSGILTISAINYRYLLS
ncbi:DUF2142 domain-containing protein [Actinobacillus pleuropneumoniae]|uniref:DUF2142 domain-containing protein n=2 Tax=Actinobacillus pleuropneumoniae TaxID=715 RepID=UPI0038506A8D